MRNVFLSRAFALCSCVAIVSSPAFGAGQIIVQYGGGGSPQFVVNGYPADQIPANACGFRLEQPGGWDGGWHFAVTSPGDIYIDPVFGEISSQQFETLPDGPDAGTAPDLPPFLQMTGPIHPDCDDNLYLFSTPAAQSLGTLEAPQATNYFVADFWDDGDIVWLGGAGEVIPFPEPLGGEPPETPDICEVAPEFCEPRTPFVTLQGADSLLFPFNCTTNPLGPGCPPIGDQVGRAIGMLAVLADSAEVAKYHLANTTRARLDRSREGLKMPLEMLGVLERRTPLIGSVLRRIERDTRLVADGATVNKLILSASAASGRAEIETRGCQRALRKAIGSVGTDDAVLRNAMRHCETLFRSATKARDALTRLEAYALPAELTRQ